VKATPRDVLRWVLIVALGAMAAGVAAIFVVVTAGKLGVVLLSTVEMQLFILTTSWLSTPLWAITALGFATAAVLLARRSKAAFWAWLAGFAGALVTQVLETTTATGSGAEIDPSGPATLVCLGLMGWGVYLLTYRTPRRLPPR
jgi:hypothetical protein